MRRLLPLLLLTLIWTVLTTPTAAAAPVRTPVANPVILYDAGTYVAYTNTRFFAPTDPLFFRTEQTLSVVPTSALVWWSAPNVDRASDLGRTLTYSVEVQAAFPDNVVWKLVNGTSGQTVIVSEVTTLSGSTRFQVTFFAANGTPVATAQFRLVPNSGRPA